MKMNGVVMYVFLTEVKYVKGRNYMVVIGFIIHFFLLYNTTILI